MPTTDTAAAAPAEPSAVALKAALDSYREELASMARADVDPGHNLDASTSAGIVIGSLPRVELHREAILARFGEDGARYLDALKGIAYATEQANVDDVGACALPDLRALHVTILQDHMMLLGDADALANRNYVPRARVDAGRPTPSYHETVTNTLVLVGLLREVWDEVATKTAVEPAELDAIEARAIRMLHLLNERRMGTTRALALDMKARALTKLIRIYGEVRAMVIYVRRWEGDAEEIAPSLWSRRRGRGRRSREDGDVVAPGTRREHAGPPAPSPVNGGEPFTS